MNLITPTTLREEILGQFPILDRDTHVYRSMEEAVEDDSEGLLKILILEPCLQQKPTTLLKKS